MFKYSFLLLLFSATVFAGNFQWEKMEGPYGGYGRAIDANNSISAIATNYGLYYKKSNQTEWKQISVTGDDFRFSAVRTIGDTIYAGNDNGTILRYIPNLQQLDFLPVQDGDIAAGSILSIFVENQHIVVGTAINQIFISDDGGTTWKITHTTDGENYAFINDIIKFDNKLFACFDSKIMYSTDDGETWSNTEFNEGDGVYIEDLYEHKGEIFLACNLGVFKSSDGMSWEAMNEGLPFDGTIGLGALNGRLFVTTVLEGIFTYDEISGNWNLFEQKGETIYTRDIVSNDDFLLITCQYNACLKIEASDENGIQYDYSGINEAYINNIDVYSKGIVAMSNSGTWHIKLESEQNSWTENRFHFPFYDFVITGEEFYGATLNGLIFIDLASGMNKQPYFNKKINTVEYFDGYIYAGAGDGWFGIEPAIYRTSDNGTTWDTLQLENEFLLSNIYEITEHDGILYLSTNSGLYTSTDLGDTWNSITETINDNQIIQGFAFNGTDIYVAVYGGSNIYYSSDQGATWNDFNTNLDVSKVNGLKTVNDKLYAYTEDGLYYSDFNNSDWKFADLTGRVTALTYHEGILYAGTNIGTFKATDITSVDENNSDQEIIVYPNPASETISITADNLNAKNIVITDITGNEVIKSEGLLTINISSLSQGIYFLRLDNHEPVKFSVIK